MFRLTFCSLLSIVLGVRCNDILTHKCLRNKGDLFVAAMAGLLKPSDSRKVDVWWGKRWRKTKV